MSVGRMEAPNELAKKEHRDVARYAHSCLGMLGKMTTSTKNGNRDQAERLKDYLALPYPYRHRGSRVWTYPGMVGSIFAAEAFSWQILIISAKVPSIDCPVSMAPGYSALGSHHLTQYLM